MTIYDAETYCRVCGGRKLREDDCTCSCELRPLRNGIFSMTRKLTAMLHVPLKTLKPEQMVVLRQSLDEIVAKEEELARRETEIVKQLDEEAILSNGAER